MSDGLEGLLARIDPARTLDETDRRADEAINSFRPECGAAIQNWDVFRYCLIRFLHHVEGCVLRLKQPCDIRVDFDWGRCCQVLMRVYGANGDKAAFEIARTGKDGGLWRVLRDFARAVSEQYADAEIAALVYTFWNGLSAEERLDRKSVV